MNDVLISAEDLAALRDSGDDLVLLDVRWSLGGPPGHEAYLAGHLPGAVYVDLDSELARHGGLRDGRHPLPHLADLQAAARRWGINPRSSVVVYDGAGNLSAARAWWLLRWAGVRSVRLLDGALDAWTAAGGDLSTDDVRPQPGEVVLSGGGLPVVDLDTVAQWPADGTVLDVRAPERFAGVVEPVDPVAGHVPGAVNLPTPGNLDEQGRFLPIEELRHRLDVPGPAVAYCGSGIHAAHTVAAGAAAGIEIALFPGSWSQWSNHEDLPVATGT